MKEELEDRKKRLEVNEKILVYCQMRIRHDRLERELTEKKLEFENARDEMQQAWRECKNSPRGVYSFREMGRLAIVVDQEHDYPALLEIR